MPENYSEQPKIVAVANQKGGVGKTTTAINLAASLSELGERVLIIDLDPQGNASTGFGISGASRGQSIANMLFDGTAPARLVQETTRNNVSIISSSPDLASADMELKEMSGRTRLLRNALSGEALRDLNVTWILIDCPPTLGMLTVNALVAANSLLVPLQAEFFALEGLTQLMQTVRGIRETSNRGLTIEGVLLTMVDRRNNLSVQVEREVREIMGDLVFKTIIPRNVRISEAPSHALSIIDYDTSSRGAQAYRDLAREIQRANARKVVG